MTPLFSRKPEPARERTEDERERARAERAARRAARSGEPVEQAPAAQAPAAHAPSVQTPPPQAPEPTPPRAEPAPQPTPPPAPVVTAPPQTPSSPSSGNGSGPAAPPPPRAGGGFRAAPRESAAGRSAPSAVSPPTEAFTAQDVAEATANVAPHAAVPEAPAEPAPAPAPTRPTSPARTDADAPSDLFDSDVVEDWSGLDADPNGSGPRRPRLPRRPGRAGAGGRSPREFERGRTSPVARIVALLAIVVAAVAIWFMFSLFQPFHGDPTGKAVALTIPKGSTISDAGEILAGKGIVSSKFFFRLRAKVSGKGSDLKPGNYKLQKNLSYVAALDALQKGPPKAPTSNITITEGHTRNEVNKLLHNTSLTGSYSAATVRSSLLNPVSYGAPRRTPSLEGFLFPATYEVRKGAPVSDLVTKQLQTFKARFSKVNLAYARSKKLSAYDVLIIASMIEREAQTKKDRPLVAAVIYNRLKIGYPLGIDATLRYILKNQTRALRESDLQLKSPYNTRINKGLPPTPIGNPGLASIQAAANPARSNVLYFVVKPGTCGEHAFSTSFEQFQRDAQRYSDARAAAGDRSPVKC